MPEGREKPWGTGQAILCAAEEINEAFAVINGDDFYGAGAFQTAADYLAHAQDGDRADYSMVGFVLRNTLSDFGSVCRGICACDENNKLQDVNECCGIERDGEGARFTDDNDQEVKLTGDELVSMNMWGFTPSIFDHIKTQFVGFLQERGQEMKSEFYIPTVVNTCLNYKAAEVTVLKSDSTWFGVTYREDKEFVENSIKKLVEQGVYPAQLF